MKIDIRIEGEPEQVARFLREMTTEQVVDLAKSGEFLPVRRAVEEFSIDELEFGVRAYNCLKRVGIETIGDIVSRTEGELASIPNFGKKGVEEVKELLAARGLRLRQYPLFGSSG